ncbi:alpha/beta hydrolase [Pseudoalteromonas rubra]|uniref:Alpha/beta hydrolase n=1 Tax=Pseudoalteromonas rubra TaxID=43658 RepID=A0A5S3WSQ8_9GAMM|nr:alpha/beta fold hydrolase [Pseudoalteromonas rubra]TMP31436.1 alpha/beta hydrolase [Pseudoalteromonas rubra]TMP34520.1 alpha/beta hydrolase [Pseudoalteromonas rubra]
MYYSESTHLTDNLVHIRAHWERCQKGTFSSGVGPLFYACHIPQRAKFAVVLVNGRIESAHKYQELMWELARNQIAVFTFDHPGQGLSGRFLANLHIGYIDTFTQYGDCLDAFMQEVVTSQWQGDTMILAHSMGGAIACDYLSRFTTSVKGAFLSAPMLAINTAPYPAWFAHGVASTACLLGLGKCYAIGQADYLPKAFEDNELTQCKHRYALFRQLYRDNPGLQLGGVSFRWLQQALQFTRNIEQLQITLPLSIASAEYDSIVSSTAQEQFAQRQTHCQIQSYPGKHELLCETDTIRRAVLDQFYTFAEQLLGYQPSLKNVTNYTADEFGDTDSDTGS